MFIGDSNPDWTDNILSRKSEGFYKPPNQVLSYLAASGLVTLYLMYLVTSH